MVDRFYSLRLWPNGEFSLGLVTRFEPRRRVKEGLPDRPGEVSWTKSEVLGYIAAMVVNGHDAEWVYKNLHTKHQETVSRSESLGLSDAPNSHTRSPRGSKGLTGHGRRMLRNACHLLEQRAGRHRVAMVTVTIPSCDEQTEKDISREWSEICRIFTQALSRRLKSAGSTPWVIGCVEIQEKRLASRGGMPLHLHLVFQSRRGHGYIISKSDVVSLWVSAVTSRVQNAGSLYWGASTRIEKVKKSVTRYMCKYMSKGINQNVLVSISQGFSLPSSWWVAVGGIKHLIKKLQFCDSGELASYLWALSVSSPKSFNWVFPISVEMGSHSYRVGYVGELSRALKSDVDKVVLALRQLREERISSFVS